jgi:hypothetical protein
MRESRTYGSAGGRAMKRVSQVRDLDVPPQLRSRPAKFISFNSSAVD